jgi:D-arabinose 1-dehydrogenase-like Zn-dependent alcohol dehydrogenase
LAALADEEFDDIIVPAPTLGIVSEMAPRLRKGGVMYLLGRPAERGKVSIDVGRIHYDNIRFYGGGDSLPAVREANDRHDLLPQGSALFIGAGGPMGQMHVQRAIEIPCGSRLVVVTDLDRSRLDHIEHRFAGMAKAKGVELRTFSPDAYESQYAMDEAVRALAPNGYTDVCVLAPVPALVAAALTFAADNALVNLFAGIPIGNSAGIELADLCRGVKVIGSSGSRISDLRKVLEMVESGLLNTDMSVAAIGGLNVAREGLEGVKAGRFPGKTVIYPQILELPLMSVDEAADQIPELQGALGEGIVWTKQAEAVLLEKYAR